jgi:hypothetical protein
MGNLSSSPISIQDSRSGQLFDNIVILIERSHQVWSNELDLWIVIKININRSPINVETVAIIFPSLFTADSINNQQNNNIMIRDHLAEP